MERLTYFESGKWRIRLGNTEFSGDWVNRFAAYEDTGLEQEEINELLLKVATLETIESMYDGLGNPDHLCELVQAEQDGRLVVLPCRVGTHIWIEGREAVISEFFGYETERYFRASFFDDLQTIIDVPFCEIGKTVFLTREDAALKGGAE